MVAASQKLRALSQLRAKECAIIGGFKDDHLASKLMAMGVLPGGKVQICMVAPFGGGCIVKVDNQKIALRSNEANNIVVR